MAASKGVKNWNRNWRGLGNTSTIVKFNSVSLYDKDGKKITTTLSKGMPVTYIDNLSESFKRDTSETKYVAISGIGEDTFYTNIDNLVEPKTLGLPNLSPQSFGLGGTKQTVDQYISSLIRSINSRSDIKGELKEYLLELINFADKGSQSIVGYDLSNLEMSNIVKQFGETIGPIHCVRRGFSSFNLGINNGTKIFIPSSLTQPLLDYNLITTTNNIKVSGKSIGNSNTLKMTSLVPRVLDDSNLLNKYISDPYFNVMRIINDNSMVSGPIKACEYLGFITTTQARSLIREPLILDDQQLALFHKMITDDPFLNKKKTISSKEISYICEKLLISYSKRTTNSNKFTTIVKDILANELYLARFSLGNGIPNFNIQSTTSMSSISSLIFRSKNGYNNKSDKLGFKI